MADTDFDGDGRADLLWRRADGLVTTWFSTGTGFRENTAFSQAVSTDWRVAATGDFDGDGRGDILWRKDDGQLSVWTSNGTTFDAGFSQMVDTAWTVETVGDFNGDGRADLFWRRDDGLVTTWLADAVGGFADAADPVEFVAAQWKVAGAGDVNGDGRDDVVWQKDNRQLTVWTSDGTVPVKNDAWNQFPYYAEERNGYTIEIGDFTADDRADLWMQHYARYVNITVLASAGTRFDPTAGSTFTGAMQFLDRGVGDVDGDGVDDIISYREGQLTVSLVDPAPAAGGTWSRGAMIQAGIPPDWGLIML